MKAIEFPDLEALLVGYFTAGLTQWHPDIDREFPDTDWVAGWAVVVRDNSGPDKDIVTGIRQIGVTFIGPEGHHAEVKKFAERGATLLRLTPSTRTLPIADATVRSLQSLGAVKRVEFYLTAELVVVGQTVTI